MIITFEHDCNSLTNKFSCQIECPIFSRVVGCESAQVQPSAGSSRLACGPAMRKQPYLTQALVLPVQLSNNLTESIASYATLCLCRLTIFLVLNFYLCAAQDPSKMAILPRAVSFLGLILLAHAYVQDLGFLQFITRSAIYITSSIPDLTL